MTTHAVAAEWTKIRTLRSTWTTLAGAALVSIMLGFVVPTTQIADWETLTAAQRADIEPISVSLVGVLFATILVGALAVRSITGEYTTGMIRLSFSAIPHRRRVVLAKTGIIAALAFPAALVGNVVAFLLGQSVFAKEGIDVSITDPGAARAVLLGSAAVSVVAVLGIGLGSLMRRTTGATVLLAVAIVGSQIFSEAVPEGARRYLPGAALQAVVSGDTASDLLSPWAALAMLTTYAVVALVAALALIERRDA